MGDIRTPFELAAQAAKPGGHAEKKGGAAMGGDGGAAPKWFPIAKAGEEFTTRLYKEGGKSSDFIEVYATQFQSRDGSFKLKPVAIKAPIWNGTGYDQMRLPIPEGFDKAAEIKTIVERPQQRRLDAWINGRQETVRHECGCDILTPKEFDALEAIGYNQIYKAGVRIAEGKAAGITAAGVPTLVGDRHYVLPLMRGNEQVNAYFDLEGQAVGVSFNVKNGKGNHVTLPDGPNMFRPGSSNPAAELGKFIDRADKAKGLSPAARSSVDQIRDGLAKVEPSAMQPDENLLKALSQGRRQTPGEGIV